jgi:subtilisin family serine protease
MKQLQLRAILRGILMAAGLVSVAGSARAADPPKPLVRPGEIILQVSPSLGLSAVDQLSAAAGCEVIRPLAFSPGVYLLGVKGRDQTLKVSMPSAAMQEAIVKLRLSAGVTADPNYIRYFTGMSQKSKQASRVTAPPAASITPNDTLHSQLWHMAMIRMPEAWNIQIGTGTVLVGVIDSGIERNHPDLLDASGVSRVVDHQSFGGSNPGVDLLGHGTHVGGTIGATTNNGNRVSSVAGWNRGGLNTLLVDANVDSGAGDGSLSSAGIVQGINYCVSKPVKVINMSLGGYFDSSAERAAIKNAVDAGVVVVASAGNGTTDHGALPGYPSDYPGVIKVTSVGFDKKLTWYSDYGFTENSQIIAAPGGSLDGNSAHDVLSLWPVNGAALGQGQNGVNAIAGTSMASPHVAGAAALLVGAGVKGPNVYKALADGAQLPNEPLSAQKHGPGVLDVYSALLPYSDPAPSLTVDGGTVITNGGSDRGISYFGATPIDISLRGVGRVYASGPPAGTTGLWSLETDITVEVQTIGRTPSIVKSFVGGRNVTGQPNRFEIPVLPTGASKSTVFNGVRVPAKNSDGSYTPITLSPGQYRIVGKVNLRNASGIVSTSEQVQFLTIVEKRLNAGRTMFAVPFKAGVFIRPATEPNLTPEAALLGSAASFSIARYNPLRSLSDDDYARFRSNDPFSLQNAARFDIVDQLDKRVIAFDTTNPTSSIAPIGLGYWLDLDRAGGVSTTLLPYPSQIPGVSPIAENSVGINVYASGGGWNMIGAPFTYPVDWSVVTVRVEGVSYSIADATKAGIISPALIGFASGDYVYSIAPSGQLEPFNGYWVRVFRDCTLLVPPVPSAAISRARGSSAAGAEGWRARLVASVAGDTDGQNYFGQARNANEKEDAADILKPPAGAGHAYVRFVSETTNGAGRSLAFDMRPVGGSTKQEWTAVVTTDRPNASVVLSWEGIRSAPRNARFTLVDTLTGARVPMAGVSSHTFKSGEPGTSRSFKIILESQASGGVLAIRSLRSVPGASRSGNGWTFGLTTNVDADIQGVIETLTGRQIAVLAGKGRSQAGREVTLAWDGRNGGGGSVAPGPYRVKVFAKSADGQTAVHQVTITNVR